ncbi:uncharacterized protein LOC118184567 isoform X2 [Stegodyphus dumicola]|uniref:uncharacterized protein LOC118184567 isoform X2 n=1 Tax=Stegodyphus dumicola TaxID=202533 RepID=UPI0015AD68D7|nr:uncharacterized protein LOC118184567 isoform X2 [Stegodyphus dumicola]
MLEWNTRHRPLSFSHQEVTSECSKNHRQLRHSYSQREVSRHSRQASVESLTSSSVDLKKQLATSVESVSAWTNNNPTVTKSTPHLAQGRTQRHSTSSGSLLQSDLDESAAGSMVTRRFKKGSVYDALASTSGLDFSPVVQLKTYNTRRDEASPLMQVPKPPDKLREKTSKLQLNSSPSSDSSALFFKDKPLHESHDTLLSSLNVKPSQSPKENKRDLPPPPPPTTSKLDGTDAAKCIAAHEKYPSWPVTAPTTSSVTYRSHSWTGQTDYPKEKIAYSRPKKAHQYKISTNQLQPVLERAPDYNSNKNNSDCLQQSEMRNNADSYHLPYPTCNSSAGDCNGKQFDFEAFHTPCIPHCYEDKNDYRIHSPPERDISPAASSSAKSPNEMPVADSNGFLSRYEDVLRHQAQYSVPLSSAWSKQGRIPENKHSSAAPDTPFLDRLRLENSWQMPPPPVPIHPAAVPQIQHQAPPGNDFELSSENGTWMGSMESSSHGRGIPKWQGSYSDLSTLSTQLSNRSSLFDSGHSTMPESGRLSPQSSCDSTAPSLLLEGATRAEVVARHGCHREIVAHSARVQQPERHGSESVLYYATGSPTRPNSDAKVPSKNMDIVACGSQMSAEEAMYRSHASLTLSPSLSKSNLHEVPESSSKSNKCPSRQDSRKSSNSFSSEDSYPRSRCPEGDDTSGSSSDVSNITCITNYKSSAKSKSLEKTSPLREILKSKDIDSPFSKYKYGYEPSKSKSMDETTRKFVFPEADKRQRVSDPELKAIQKQAVMSFYQRMSLAESIKSDQKLPINTAGSDIEPPPPYESSSSSSRLKMSVPKLSFPKNLNKQPQPKNSNQMSPQALEMLPKSSDSGLLNSHSKSVPNLVMLKGQSLDLPPSHPIFKQTYNGQSWVCENNQNLHKKRGSPLAKDEIISWDQLPNVLEKKREAFEKAAPSSESKDPPEDNGGCSSGMHYLKPHRSPRKVQLKEVHHSNETASVKVMTPDGVTLVQTNERKEEKTTSKGPPHKRRPAPPPPPKQPPKRPPPPPPPVTPPPPQVVVVMDGAENDNSEKFGELRIDVKPPSLQLLSSASSPQLLHSYGSSSLSPPSSCCDDTGCPSSPELPLPPPPSADGSDIVMTCDEPLPPPPDPRDVDVQPRILDSSSLIYPKNSYMSYRSERKLGRQGFDGKYRRSFHTSASSVDLTTLGTSFQDGKIGFSPSSWEQIHNIRQHGTTVIFHSDCLNHNNRLQRSSSQDCILAEETSHNGTDNISNGSLEVSENNQSSTSISTQCSESKDIQLQSVPYRSPSHERINIEVQNSFSDTQHNMCSTKVKSSKSKCTDNTLTNSESGNKDQSSLDNSIFQDNSFVDSESDTTLNVDHNQNAVHKNEESNSKVVNGNDLINRINSATQTTDTPRLHRKLCKTKEELECERLSMDFIHHYGDVTLKNLLVPAPNHKTMSDYMEGLLNLELENGGYPARRCKSAASSTRTENGQKDEKLSNNEKSNSLFESKRMINHCLEMNDNQNVSNESELRKKKEQLILSISKKVETLRSEQTNVRAEMLQNELLGEDIANRLQALAKPNELEKYSLHVEEMEKIVNLLLSLSGRLARAENILKSMPKDSSSDEKRILEAKRDKLLEQHEDARRLKESIDRRSSQVSTFLHRYLSDDEYANYDRFIKMKTKLIVDNRELDEKINLGEEQLAALSVVAHLWKSANS